MTKYTQKAIKGFVKDGLAQDITKYNMEQMQILRANHHLEKIGGSFGVYGPNGGLYKDRDTGTLYAITARTTALFCAPIW